MSPQRKNEIFSAVSTFFFLNEINKIKTWIVYEEDVSGENKYFSVQPITEKKQGSQTFSSSFLHELNEIKTWSLTETYLPFNKQKHN